MTLKNIVEDIKIDLDFWETSHEKGDIEGMEDAVAALQIDVMRLGAKQRGEGE